LESHSHTLVDVADDLEPFAYQRRVEFDLRKNRGIGMEVDGGTAAARSAQLLQRAGRLSTLEAHLPLGAVALDGCHELSRQRVHDARAHAVETSGRLVVALLELTAGMEHGEDHFERALLGRGMFVDRNPTSVIGNRNRAAVLVQRHDDVRGVAVHRLVDRVVEHFPDEVVQPSRADATDVHTGAFTNRLETFENGDVFCGVVGHSVQLVRLKPDTTYDRSWRPASAGPRTSYLR